VAAGGAAFHKAADAVAAMAARREIGLFCSEFVQVLKRAAAARLSTSDLNNESMVKLITDEYDGRWGARLKSAEYRKGQREGLGTLHCHYPHTATS
jgi:phosphoribosylaminoimidazole carboxylase (NCAIR synthetase)